MFNFFKTADESFVKNRPAIWLTKCHIFIPAAIVIVFALIGLQSILPFNFNVYYLFTFTLLSAILFAILFVRAQFLYFDISLKSVQLHKIFWINFVYFLLCVIITMLPPLLFSYNVKKRMEQRNFDEDQKKIKVAMIPYRQIEIIKMQLATDSIYLDSLYDADLTAFNNLKYEIAEITSNKFINQSLDRISLPTPTVASVDSAKTDTAFVAVPDTAKSADTSHSFFKKYRPGPGVLLIADNNYNWNTEFLIALRKMPYEEIDSIKRNISSLLNAYRFKRYEGDTTMHIYINDYFDALNRESLALYSNTSFVHEYGTTLFLLFYTPLTAVLTALIFCIFFLKTSPAEKSIAILFATAMCFGVINIFNKENLILIFFIAFFIISLLWVFFVQFKEKNSAVKISSVLMVYLTQHFVIWLAYIYGLLYVGDINIFSNEDEFSVLGVVIIILLFIICLFFLNRLFMKRIFIINNTPKQH